MSLNITVKKCSLRVSCVPRLNDSLIRAASDCMRTIVHNHKALAHFFRRIRRGSGEKSSEVHGPGRDITYPESRLRVPRRIPRVLKQVQEPVPGHMAKLDAKVHDCRNGGETAGQTPGIC